MPPETSPVPPSAPELTVIIISYNTRELTLAALRTLYKTTRKTAFHTVVYDNDSKDGSPEAIAAEFPQVELIASKDNLGFARANNVVAAQARTEWLLLLNPDTECHEGAVDNLLAFSKAHPEAGITGGRTVFRDGSLNAGSCFKRITLWSIFCASVGLTAAFPKSEVFNPEMMPDWKRDSVREVDVVVGCFLMIRRELWNRLGGFDLRYYMYGEEADLCLRARKLGYHPMITPDAEIMHIVGAASTSLARKRIPLTKARITLLRDHWPKWQVPLGLGLFWFSVFPRYVVANGMSLLPGEKNKARKVLWDEMWRTREDWLKGY
ncbi:glycosyl transferase family 2 [Haematobacter missouriensis]|uniref:Glycosyl transferase family 2 n=1 Tax=Haematobacter missouriensis TaxID=366616 RepID=A0A212ARJ6_9RHOB|nr:glycosyltransferase family 2 protein [Haematobacter missouriensis]OWJ84111.1 glycosyl transferase family 2 [Haematobacter missouriensis]